MPYWAGYRKIGRAAAVHVLIERPGRLEPETRERVGEAGGRTGNTAVTGFAGRETQAQSRKLTLVASLGQREKS